MFVMQHRRHAQKETSATGQRPVRPVVWPDGHKDTPQTPK